MFSGNIWTLCQRVSFGTEHEAVVVAVLKNILTFKLRSNDLGTSGSSHSVTLLVGPLCLLSDWPMSGPIRRLLPCGSSCVDICTVKLI